MQRGENNERDSLSKRYDAFCEHARDLLNRSGLTPGSQTPVITGRAFYDACVALAAIHFPDDKEVNGVGPRGLLWGMYAAVNPPHVGGRSPDPVSGAKSIALVLEQIIKNRPPLDIENPVSPDEASSLAVGEKRKRRQSGVTTVFIVHGHDGPAKDEVARFCEHLGLRTIVLHELANRGLTIIEKFEGHADFDFAVVLLTSDDIGYPRNKPEEARPRARQNAIFEWGYFIGTLGALALVPFMRLGLRFHQTIMASCTMRWIARASGSANSRESSWLKG